MEKYVLIGHPLGHSMSPFIHNKLFEMGGKQVDYKLNDINPENFNTEAKELRSLNGYNITIPYKTNIIPFTDSLDESAERYKSVNCVCNKDGKAIGYNTDCDGFLRSLEGFPLDGKVILLGCGGVGRMMAIEAVLHGADLTIAIIEPAKAMAETLIAELKEIAPEKEVTLTYMDKISGHFDLLINATPVGMYPKSDACPVSDEVIQNCDTFFDAIYNPTKTKLIKKAESLGKKARGGMAMLVLQAVKAHEIWHGDTYSAEQIETIIKESEAKVEADFS